MSDPNVVEYYAGDELVAESEEMTEEAAVESIDDLLPYIEQVVETPTHVEVLDVSEDGVRLVQEVDL